MSAPLECGRDPETVAEHAAAGTLDDHERECPYCGQVASAVGLSQSLGRQAAEAGEAGPSRDLVAGVMKSVRAELRHARQLPLPTPEGAAFVTDHVVATVLRDALDSARGLVVRSCRVEMDAAGLGVRLDTLGRWPADLTRAADDARTLVREVVQREFGMGMGAVDVAVVDLIGPSR